MSVCRVRLGRDFPVTGRFDWAQLDERGTVLESASSELATPPRGQRCEVVLGAELVLLERVSVPAAQQRRLRPALRFLVEDSVVPDPARVHVAAEPAGEKNVLHLAIVDRDWFAQALGRLQRLGLAPVAASSECLLPPLEPGAWAVISDGVDGFARTGEREGFALDSAVQGEPPAALRLALDAAREAGRAPQRIVLRTAADAAPPDAGSWSRILAIPVECGPPWSWLQPGANTRLDLLQGEFAPQAGAGSWAGRLRRTALLAAATIAVASCGLAGDWALKTAERDRLKEEMRTLYRDTFGPSAVIVDPALQMSRAHAELRALAGDGSGGEFLILLDALATRVAASGAQSAETLTYEPGRLTLTLRARDPRQAAAIATQLRAKANAPGMHFSVEEAEGGLLRLTAMSRG